MPFYLHDQKINADVLLSSGQYSSYDTKDRAIADRVKGQTITYLPNVQETAVWQARERERFANNTYAHVPWSNYSMDSAEIVQWHYAHVSLQFPGLIAYTPSFEHGHQDRQVRTTPGKYLAQFATSLDSGIRDQYISEVKAFAESFKIATSAADIRAVYVNGPNSCMSGKFPYQSVHPSAVYAGSDLSVAYLGDLETKTIRARSIIWPAKKYYSRVYGDTTLVTLLQQSGYSCRSPRGAKIRAIQHNGGYIMPYVDGIDSADLVYENGQDWFLLNNDGDYSTTETDGHIDGTREPENTCSNCSNECGEDESYCSSCDDARWTCDHCEDGEDHFDSGHSIDNETWCDSCERDERSTCAHPDCSEVFYLCTISDDDREWRKANRVDDMCIECSDKYHSCANCGELWIVDGHYEDHYRDTDAYGTDNAVRTDKDVWHDPQFTCPDCGTPIRDNGGCELDFDAITPEEVGASSTWLGGRFAPISSRRPIGAFLIGDRVCAPMTGVVGVKIAEGTIEFPTGICRNVSDNYLYTLAAPLPIVDLDSPF